MEYYDSKGNLVELNKSSTSYEGRNAIVYKLENGISFKEYFCSGDTIISQSMFEFLKSVNNPNFINLIDRYYKSLKVKDYKAFLKSISDTTPTEDIRNIDTYKIDAYTYYWIEQESIDFLEEDKEYILENFRALLNLADYFSQNRIGLADIKTDNVICNQNNIVLIDPDMYYFIPEFSKTDIHKKNRLRIIYLMSSLCCRLTRHKSYETTDKVTGLFKESLERPEHAEKILSKSLRNYKKAIDYIRK